MRPIPVIAALVMLCVAGIVVAQDVTVVIRYQDKEIYVPGSDVLIRFTIRNDRADTYRFRVAENRMFNVDFVVRTLSNVPLAPAPHFTTERTSNQQLYYRDVVLEPGEEFSFVENLTDYVRIAEPGVYVVTGRFYPALVSTAPQQPAEAQAGPSDTPAINSNTLSLTVRPDLSADGRTAAAIDDRTGEILARESLPPDEIVAYVINALQAQAWNRYFLYIDLEGLLQSDAARARSYARLSDANRVARLEEFAAELRTALVDPQISAIPTNFRMVRTTYDPDEATVIMDEEFAFPTFSEIKRYTYFLRRRDRVWYIYDYAVTNLGSE